MQNEQTLKELSLHIVDGLKNRRKNMVPNVTYFRLGCMLLDLIVGGDKGVYGVPGAVFGTYVVIKEVVKLIFVMKQ